MGKVLTEVRSPKRKLMPDTEDWEQHELTSLRGIAYKQRQNRRADIVVELKYEIFADCESEYNRGAP